MSIDVMQVLLSVNAILKGHFVLTNENHADTYVNKDAVYPHTELISELCREMARGLFDADLGIQVVIGPALGGIALSQYVAGHLSRHFGKEILSVYAEKAEGGFVFKRGYDKLIAGKKALVVEDVLTTGKSVRRVVEAARACGADVRAVSALVNRGRVSREAVGDVPVFNCLLSVDIPSYSEGECPFCKQDVPVNTDVGKGKEYLAKLSGIHTL